MAYTHSKGEVLVSTTELNRISKLTSGSGEFGRWAGPFYIPHIVRAIGVSVLVTDTLNGNVIMSFRTATRGAASITDNEFERVTVACGGNLQGKVFYTDNLDKEIAAGLDVVVQNLSTNTIGTMACHLYVEPRWETPANQTTLNESA